VGKRKIAEHLDHKFRTVKTSAINLSNICRHLY
jgi:hypothetical protein